MVKVAVGSDHGGFEYKAKIIDYLKGHNFDYVISYFYLLIIDSE